MQMGIHGFFFSQINFTEGDIIGNLPVAVRRFVVATKLVIIIMFFDKFEYLNHQIQRRLITADSIILAKGIDGKRLPVDFLQIIKNFTLIIY